MSGIAINTGGAYAAEDVTAAAFRFENGGAGTGIWNFNSGRKVDTILVTGSTGSIFTPVFTDADVIVTHGTAEEVIPVRNPPHVHQPLIQTIVDELRGQGTLRLHGRERRQDDAG